MMEHQTDSFLLWVVSENQSSLLLLLATVVAAAKFSRVQWGTGVGFVIGKRLTMKPWKIFQTQIYWWLTWLELIDLAVAMPSFAATASSATAVPFASLVVG